MKRLLAEFINWITFHAAEEISTEERLVFLIYLILKLAKAPVKISTLEMLSGVSARRLNQYAWLKSSLAKQDFLPEFQSENQSKNTPILAQNSTENQSNFTNSPSLSEKSNRSISSREREGDARGRTTPSPQIFPMDFEPSDDFKNWIEQNAPLCAPEIRQEILVLATRSTTDKRWQGEPETLLRRWLLRGQEYRAKRQVTTNGTGSELSSAIRQPRPTQASAIADGLAYVDALFGVNGSTTAATV